MGLDYLHEGGGGVHPPAEAVGLPADDGVEASLPGVGQHPLELGALFGPPSAHLLIAGRDGEPLALAVGFQLPREPPLPPPREEYMGRRTGEGMTKLEVIRCLKRYVARQVYSILSDMGRKNLATAAI